MDSQRYTVGRNRMGWMVIAPDGRIALLGGTITLTGIDTRDLAEDIARLLTAGLGDQLAQSCASDEPPT